METKMKLFNTVLSSLYAERDSIMFSIEYLLKFNEKIEQNPTYKLKQLIKDLTEKELQIETCSVLAEKIKKQYNDLNKQ